LLLPSARLFTSGLGLYAGTVGESPSRVAKEVGLHGLIAAQVSSTAASGARWIVFVDMVPLVLYALVKLYRAIAIVYAIVWHGSGRSARVTPKKGSEFSALRFCWTSWPPRPSVGSAGTSSWAG
jgi:hypothetical protein